MQVRVEMLERRNAMLERRIEKLERALRLQFALSRSTAAPVDTGPVQTIQGQIDPLSLKDGIPTLMNYGFSSSLPIGGDKAVMFLGGDRSQAVVVATGHQLHRFTGLLLGESVMHDMWGHSIHLTASGITIQCAALPVNFVNAGTITMQTPLLQVSGDIIDNYTAANSLNLAQTRTDHNTHVHNVPGVQGGSATVLSSVPTTTEV